MPKLPKDFNPLVILVSLASVPIVPSRQSILGAPVSLVSSGHAVKYIVYVYFLSLLISASAV